jgi:hypothetical protein
MLELYTKLNNRQGRKIITGRSKNKNKLEKEVENIVPYPIPVQLAVQLKKESDERSLLIFKPFI